MSNQIVAVDLNQDGEFVMCELVVTKGGWTTVIDPNGVEHKVRNSQVAMNDDDEQVDDFLTDDDGESDEVSGDVFPPGIRETYARGTTEDGVNFIDCGDWVASALRGQSLEAVATVAAAIVQEPKLTQQGWLDLYDRDRVEAGKNALNVGMRRMNIGNRIRGAIKARLEDDADYDFKGAFEAALPKAAKAA